MFVDKRTVQVEFHIRLGPRQLIEHLDDSIWVRWIELMEMKHSISTVFKLKLVLNSKSLKQTF